MCLNFIINFLVWGHFLNARHYLLNRKLFVVEKKLISIMKQYLCTLTRINNDLLRAIDDNACVILVLLDLSAAFDTVDHQILLTRLKCRYGVKGNALAWMRSYLSNRFQYVRVANDCSSKHKLACGVHERFITWPLNQIEARVASKQRIILQ